MRTDLNRQLVELIPRLRRFASGLSGDRDRGDDLVQSACERLLKHQDRLRPDSRLDSWMFQVIRNLYIDSCRERAVRDRTAGEVRRVADLYVVTNDSFDQQLQLREVMGAMQELSEEHRSVLMLICVEGLSYKQAAEILQVPMGTVASRLIRARRALIDRIGDEKFVRDLGASK